MSNERNIVISWIRSGMDYYEGLEILVTLTAKPQLRGQFNGGMKHLSGKLAYEICKAAKVADIRTWKTFIQEVRDSPMEVPKENSKGKQHRELVAPETQKEIQHALRIPIVDPEHLKDATLEENPLKEYPAIIRRLMYEYASMFQERSKLHTVMTEMDSSNAPAVMEKRAELFDLIKALSIKLEKLYLAKNKFELDGTLPIESELFPPESQPEVEDIGLLDEESLKNRKKNLQNANSKDQSMLDYQSAKHGTTKNPMPDGPKRIKIEHRMKQRIKLMEEIDNALLKYVIK